MWMTGFNGILMPEASHFNHLPALNPNPQADETYCKAQRWLQLDTAMAA